MQTQQQNIHMSVVVVDREKIRGDDQPQKRHAAGRDLHANSGTLG